MDRYECPNCKYPGKYLTEVFTVRHRIMKIFILALSLVLLSDVAGAACLAKSTLSANFTWDAYSFPAGATKSGYHIGRSLVQGGDVADDGKGYYGTVVNATPPATSAIDTNVQMGKTYYYVVSISYWLNGLYNLSGPSNEVCVTFSTNAAPNPPGNLQLEIKP